MERIEKQKQKQKHMDLPYVHGIQLTKVFGTMSSRTSTDTLELYIYKFLPVFLFDQQELPSSFWSTKMKEPGGLKNARLGRQKHQHGVNRRSRE